MDTYFLHYPNDIDRSLHEAVSDKIGNHRSDYNNNPPDSISFMPVIGSTSGRLHSEFVLLLFLQDHRETDRFFAVSGVQLTQSNNGLFHFRLAAFSSQLKSKVNRTLATYLTINKKGKYEFVFHFLQFPSEFVSTVL